ncbi:hypothetical protein, partial [Sediminibacterium ginsengisoli]
MGFLDGIFKPLPGGTEIGNTLRKVAYEVSGGVLGNGSAKITQVDYDLTNLSDSEYLAKYGKTKAGVVDPTVTPNPDIYAVDQQIRGGINKPSSIWLTVWGFIKKWWWLVLPFPVVL